jgi:hypothetical protein
MPLNLEPNLQQPDDFYEALIDMHRGLDEAQSHHVNARLVLVLSNHIGDLEVLREAMRVARGDLAGAAPEAAAPDTARQWTPTA